MRKEIVKLSKIIIFLVYFLDWLIFRKIINGMFYIFIVYGLCYWLFDDDYG